MINMKNKDVISDMRLAVKKLIQDQATLEISRQDIFPFSPQERQQRRRLRKLALKIKADIDAMKSIIRERLAAETSFPPLTKAKAEAFKKALVKLNKVIQADQGFDAIVRIAQGISKASDDIDKLL